MLLEGQLYPKCFPYFTTRVPNTYYLASDTDHYHCRSLFDQADHYSTLNKDFHSFIHTRCNTSATRATQVRHKCEMSDMSST